MISGFDLDRAREALQFLDAGTDRETWVRVLMSAKAAGLAEDDAQAWSATAPSYREGDFRSTWRSIKADGAIGPGSLFREARAAGWQPQRERRNEAPRQPEAARKAPRPGVNDGQEPPLFDGEVAVLEPGWFRQSAQAAQVCVG
jgi:hypothetical protein